MPFLPVDLLMEHIQEIRTLRKRLEESIKTNEKLRKQLERQGSEFDQGKKGLSPRVVQARRCFLGTQAPESAVCEQSRHLPSVDCNH